MNSQSNSGTTTELFANSEQFMNAMRILRSASDRQAIQNFAKELKAYGALHELQEEVTPVLHSFGQMSHVGCPAIVTYWAGCYIQAYHLSCLSAQRKGYMWFWAEHHCCNIQ